VRRLLWILLFGLGLALVVLVARHDSGTIGGVWPHEFPSLVFYTVLLVFVGSAVIAIFRRRWLHALESALLWVVVAVLLMVGYTYRLDLREVGDRVLAEVIPGRPAARGKTVEIARSRGGEFTVAVQINGVRVPMTLDTGASSVVLTQEAAKAAGLPLEVLSYSVNVETANGRARAAPVTIDRLAVGNIVERSIPALIAQPGQLRMSLLGMSFLNRLEGWEVRGDRLVMRGFP
jgi:aspartyl protease family protein